MSIQGDEFPFTVKQIMRGMIDSNVPLNSRTGTSIPQKEKEKKTERNEWGINREEYRDLIGKLKKKGMGRR